MKKNIIKLLAVALLSVCLIAGLASCDLLGIKSIVSIEKTATEGNVDTYTIYYSNGDEFNFTVTNGKDGIDGINGTNGTDGADGKDGTAPVITIGGNGNWYIDGVDSGISAKGEKGEPGKDAVAPVITIGQNGNWYIDGTDTGVSAKGESSSGGTKAEITIGDNGNWYIDGVDSGVSAKGEKGEPGTPGTNGTNGTNGTDGKDGATPVIKVTDGEIWISYDGGVTYSYSGKLESEGTNMTSTVTITASDIESGKYNYAVKGTSSTRLRSKNIIPITAGSVITYDPNGIALKFNVMAGTDSGIDCFLQTTDGWKTEAGEFKVAIDGYLAIMAASADTKSTITAADYAASISIDMAEQSARVRKVYRFGGEGNDWCFVYLPEGYDENRAQPYPLVIANHGNGWRMGPPTTGTVNFSIVSKCNYTDNNIYLPVGDPLLTSEPGQHIATDDPTLWYSSPTIETLLKAGYVVAGAQNYGDALYGNDDCANACVDFFNHMVSTYNVENSCYMIGASNGAMTTLNASAKLGERVKAIILQYPLTCLIDQYSANKNHQSGIESAYGLDTTLTYTKDELLAVIAKYDPLYANVVDGVKQGYFPAVKIYYSTTDTTTKASVNALPLIAMLENSGKEVVGIQVDTDGASHPHGDAVHFRPYECVDWFNSHR